MKQKVVNIINSPFFAGSVVMIIGSNATNALNYVYHLVMGRLLVPASYGELAAIFSLMGLLNIIPSSFGLVLVKYVSSAKTKEEVSGFLHWIRKKIIIFTLLSVFLIIISSSSIATFLNIKNNTLIVLAGLTFLFSLPAFFNRSALQGLLNFNKIVISTLAENSIKLVLGVILVIWGLSVGGAIAALTVAALVSWLLSELFIKKYRKIKVGQVPHIKSMTSYAIPVFIQSLAITSINSTDLVLVKHFFSSYDAGLYAALSTLGKIIFFGSGPIAAVMFPMVSQQHAKGGNYRKVLYYSLILTILFSSTILFIYWLIPNLAISSLYGSSYLQASGLLIFFGIFMTLFTLASLLINFNLSLGKTKVVVFPLIAAFFQALGIWLYHDSLKNVILISVFDMLFLLLSLLVYYFYQYRNPQLAKDK